MRRFWRGDFVFVEVALGGFHSCARQASRAVVCWGYNVYGALGDGTRTPLELSAEVACQYAGRVAKSFGVGPDKTARFDKGLAKADLAEDGKKKKKPAGKAKD